MSVNNKVMKHQELLQCIEGIVTCYLLSCSHLVLTAIKTSLTCVSPLLVIFLVTLNIIDFNVC